MYVIMYIYIYAHDVMLSQIGSSTTRARSQCYLPNTAAARDPGRPTVPVRSQRPSAAALQNSMKFASFFVSQKAQNSFKHWAPKRFVG